MSGPVRHVEECSPLEFRLESLKRTSNASLNFLKRLFDRRSVAELYLQGDVDLHVHFLTRNGVFCARLCAFNIEKAQPVSRREHVKSKSTLVEMKAPVLIRVGKIPKEWRPVATLIRLEPLDCCYMSRIEAIEPTSLLPERKSLLLAFDWKLRALNNPAGIENSQLINQIIEGGSEVVANLPNKDAKEQGDSHITFDRELELARSFQIKIPGNRIMLLLPEGFNSSDKVSKVFSCPS